MKLMTSMQRRASGRTVLALFVLTNVVYLTMLLYSIPSVTTQAPGMRLFDMSPIGYSPQYAKDLLDAIGPEGRESYLEFQLPLDFIYPGLFALTYSLMLVWLFKKRLDPASKLFFLALVPAAAGFFDYLENLGIIIMLRSYPGIDPGVVWTSSTFSLLKSFLTILFYILLLGGFLLLFLKRKRPSF
jgi:hypothetical protein